MTRTLLCRGVPYAIDEYGSDGPVVLFGHGLYFDRSMFESVAKALGAGWRCVCMDWPGHGQSGWRAEGWTVQDLVSDAVAMLDALGAKKAILVGLSQGGAVFTRLALQHPERVLALVIMDASPDAPPAIACQRMLDASAALASGDAKNVSDIYDSVVERMFSSATQMFNPTLIERSRARMSQHSLPGMAQAVRLGLSYQSIKTVLHTLAMPTLVLWGEDDQATPVALSEAYRAIAGVTLRTFPAAGHSLALEQPSKVAFELSRFFNEHGIHPLAVQSNP